MRWTLSWIVLFLGGCATTAAAPAGAEDDLRGLENPTFEARLISADHAEAPAELAAPPQAPTVERQVIYSAGLRIVVVSAQGAMQSIQHLAETVGGYLQESDARSITIRVPAAKFEATLAEIATLGEVVDRNLKASDVTEQMLDLNIRLENARKTRERLLEHLSQSTKIEDTLKIEAELSRVSGDIEQMEGKLRFLNSQIAMSTIRVELNTNVPQNRDPSALLGLPFAWLEHLGDGLLAGNVESKPRKPNFFSGGPKFDPPKDFVRYYSNDDLVEALSADGVRLKVQRQSNYDKGALGFWTKLARKSLVQSRSLAVSAERDLDDHRAVIAGTRLVAGEQWGYVLVLTCTKEHLFGKDRVLTFEAWGPKPVFDAHFDELLASAQSLKR
jgi:hypothetical protein